MNTNLFYRRHGLIGFILLAVLISCEKFPADPEDTLGKVQRDGLRAGITENPPYIIFSETGPAGSEVEMIRAFAGDLGVEVEWVKGSEEVLMTLLREGQISICAGGLNSGSVWKKHVYLTVPHDTVVYRWGVPPGRDLPGDIGDKQVYTEANSPVAAFVHKKGGQVIYRDSLNGNEPLVAASEERLTGMGYRMSKEKIGEQRKVLAVQKGENAFVEKLERFLHRYAKKSSK